MRFLDIIDKEIPEDCLVVMCGLPATGKTTLAKKISEKKGFKVLSSDSIRAEIIKEDIFDQKIASDLNKRILVYKVMFERAQEILEKERGLILDATFIRRDLRKICADIAKRYRKTLCIIETRCSKETALSRIRRRKKGDCESNAITEEAYFNNLKIFEPVSLNEFPSGSIYFLINTEGKEWFVEKKLKG